MAAFTSPPAQVNSGPLADSLYWVNESSWFVVEFKLASDYQPCGDQPQAIAELEAATGLSLRQ
jgi:hypothetical protein